MLNNEKYAVKYLSAQSPAILAVDIDEFLHQFPRVSLRKVDYFNVMEANQLNPSQPKISFSCIIIYRINPDPE